VAPSRRNTSPPTEIVEALDLAPEPAAHAGAGIAAHERLDAERRVELVPQRLPAGRVDPGDMLGGREPERHRGVERRRRLLALPVERRGVADFCDAGADRIQHLERRHHLAGRMDRDLQAAARQRRDALGDALRRHAGPGQALRPRRDHAPAPRLGDRDRGRGEHPDSDGSGADDVSACLGHGSPPGLTTRRENDGSARVPSRSRSDRQP
jgi:hypothetical protein